MTATCPSCGVEKTVFDCAHRRALAHGSVISRLASNLGEVLLITSALYALSHFIQPRALIHFLSSLFHHQPFPAETT